MWRSEPGTGTSRPPATVDPVARCIDLVRTYRTETGPVHALRGIGMSFGAGKVSAIVGPSGSGKSSLLRVLAGIDRPTAGTVEVAGVNLAHLSQSKLKRIRRRHVAYLFQRPSDNFVPHITVAQHLELVARAAQPAHRDRLVNRPSSRTHAVREHVEVLDRLGLAHRAGYLPSELSGGEQQRAALAQAIVSGAPIVVADEPTAELDDDSSSRLLELVVELARDGIAVVVATHDPHVVDVADQVVEIEHGRLNTRAQAPPERGPVGSRALVTPAHLRRRTSSSGAVASHSGSLGSPGPPSFAAANSPEHADRLAPARPPRRAGTRAFVGDPCPYVGQFRP